MRKISLLAIQALAACGDDPVDYSEPVGIEMKVKSGDVVTNAINADKGITTESGNPYGAFVTAARDKIGHDPSRIELDHLTITLNAAGSTNVAKLEEVMTSCAVQFVMNDTNDTYPAGTITNPVGTGPFEGTLNFDWDAVAAQNVAKFIGGSFKVAIAVSTATGFASKGAEADLELTFTFTAFE